MSAIEFVTIEAADPASAQRFQEAAFGLDNRVRVLRSEPPTSGFRGFTLSIVVSQPSNVDELINAAVDAGARPLKPASKSLWGYGGAVESPDGTTWTVAASSKKDTGPASREIDELVLQLGVEEVATSKRFYVDRGLTVGQSYGRRYVDFDTGPITLALYKRRALAKLAGVSADGTGSHRLIIGSAAGPFTDPDGFEWAAP